MKVLFNCRDQLGLCIENHSTGYSGDTAKMAEQTSYQINIGLQTYSLLKVSRHCRLKCRLSCHVQLTNSSDVIWGGLQHSISAVSFGA